MTKAASDVMQSVLIAAVVEAIEALRASSGGLPNNLLRDLQGVHRNAAFADLPKALQDSINQSVRTAFNQLLKEGYAVGPKAKCNSPARSTGFPSRTAGPPPSAAFRAPGPADAAQATAPVVDRAGDRAQGASPNLDLHAPPA